MVENLVSIIMPTYNRAQVITRALKSVLKQTYKNFELLIIDDGSVDDTEQVVTAIADSRICYVKLPENRGACYARNRGLERAKGEYVAFLDSDNVWLRNYLEERVKLLEQSPAKVGGVFGHFLQIQGNKTRNMIPSFEFGQEISSDKTNKVLIKRMLFDNVIDTNTIVLKKCCIDKLDGFDERIMRMQDWDYFFRVLCFSGYRLVFQENCLVKNYIQKDSITSNKNIKAFWDTRILFLNKYKNILQEYGCLHDVVLYLCSQLHAEMDENVIAGLLRAIKEDQTEKIVMQLRTMYIEKLYQAEKYMDMHAREKAIIEVQNQWLSLKRKNINLGAFLNDQGYHRIAIYGYGYLGKSLCEELLDSESACELVCVMDSKIKNDKIGELPVFHPKKAVFEADVVIVTAIANFDEVKQQYEKEIPFISLAKVIGQANCIK